MSAEKKLELIVKEIEEGLEHNYELLSKAILKPDIDSYNYINGVITCLIGLHHFIEDLE